MSHGLRNTPALAENDPVGALALGLKPHQTQEDAWTICPPILFFTLTTNGFV